MYNPEGDIRRSNNEWVFTLSMPAASAKKPTRLVEEITAALRQIDQTGAVSTTIQANSGLFFRQLYEAWYEHGGLEGGKARNSIRRMRNNWLTEENTVRSLHPKLFGKVRIKRKDAYILVRLFLTHWQYVGSKRKDDAVNSDGYIPFPTKNITNLVNRIVFSMYGEEDGQDIGILLPAHNLPDLADDSEHQPALQIFESLVEEADAVLTVSSQRTIIGPSPQEAMRLFWHLIDGFYQSEETKENIFIWVVDIGSRQVEEEDSFACYYNTGNLALHLLTVAEFSTDPQGTSLSMQSISNRLTSFDVEQRQKRWQWLLDHGAIIVKARGNAEIHNLYSENEFFLDFDALGQLDVNAEHVLPNTIPSRWIDSLKKFYGPSIDTLSAATLSIILKKKGSGRLAPRYFAASSKLTNIPSTMELDVAYSLDTTELFSPGKSYDEAFRMIYLASQYRLSRASDEREGAIATAYLRSLGFKVLKIDDFIKVFRNVPNIDISNGPKPAA